ncbi:MAG: class I SAM-dependent methyltransferase [Deltaproteobacteria bacterium]|nr:class I SAM-dependent methyltransferase [Deltaproteobacteria bacterium]
MGDLRVHPPDPYQAIAELYEAEHGQLDADLRFYAREGVNGPLLVLGCGTGRIGRTLGSCRRVTGLDASEEMLAVARRLAPEARYIRGDMRDFDLGRFAEIVIPNGAFNFLTTRADQQRCLECCHRALAQGAPLTIDTPLPDFRLLGTPHSPERLAWEGRLQGEEVRRTREVHRHPVAQRLELTDRYYAGERLLATAELRLRLLFPGEAEWMLEAAGFTLEAVHGDYAKTPLRSDSPRLLIRALRL